MDKADNRHAWIIGASSGIGAALARELAGRDWVVTVSGRRSELLQTVAGSRPEALRVLPMDVTQPGAARAAWRVADSTLDPVSHVIYMAADYAPMPLADLAAAPFEETICINYLGAVSVLEAVLPRLRRRGLGEIVLVASLAGYRGLPRSAPYNASKAALISLAESLAPEMALDGVRMRLVSPGFVRTPLTAKNEFRMPFLMEPADAARRIADGLESGGFEIAFPRRLAWPMKVLRCLPYPLYFALTSRLIRGRRV